MEDIIVIVILLAIIGLATWYVIRAKKRGKKCIGCPDGCCTAKSDGTSCCCGCSGDGSEKDSQK